MRLYNFIVSELPSDCIIACFAAKVTLYARYLGDCALRARDNSCWTAQLIEAIEGLRNGEALNLRLLKAGQFPLNEFVADIRFHH